MAAAVRRRKTVHRPEHPPLAEQLAQKTDSILMCRDMGHAWGVEHPFYKVEVEGGVRGALYVERIAVCLRCDTHRVELHRVFRDRMEKISNRYVYPEDYLLHGPDKKSARQRARLEQWLRVQKAIDELEKMGNDGEGLQ